MMQEPTMESVFERVSVPYLVELLDSINETKRRMAYLRRNWYDIHGSDRRREWASIKANYRNALTTARAAARNLRIPLDPVLNAAQERVTTEFRVKWKRFKEAYEAGKVSAKMASKALHEHEQDIRNGFKFALYEERLTELERAVQPYLLLTPQSSGQDVWTILHSDIVNDSYRYKQGIVVRRRKPREGRVRHAQA